MRFDYSGIITSAPDTGDPVAVFRPEIRIVVHGPNGAETYRALVDTGADDTILPESVARGLGIRMTRATGPAAQAFGGQAIALSYADVELELVYAEAKLRWLAHVYFVAGTEEETILLGQQGFLEFFTATFIGDECVLELQPNSYLLPR
jgi:predicted aspartyl protease